MSDYFLPEDFELAKPEIYSFIDEEKDTMITDAQYNAIFSTEEVTRLEIPDVPYAGVGPMVAVGNTGDAVPDKPIEGFKTVTRNQTYAKVIEFSQDLWQTDQHNKVEEMSRDLPRAVAYSRNLVLTGVLRNAWNPTFLYGNGKPYASITHPLKNGSGTFANTYTDGVQRPVNYDNALKLRDEGLLSQVSDSGNILNIGTSSRKHLLIGGPSLQQKLFELADVSSDQRPDTANRAMNWFVKGANYDVLILDFMRFEAAKQSGETGTITKGSSSDFWSTSWAVADVDILKQYLKLYVRKGYKAGKYYDEVTKRNRVMNFFGEDNFGYAAVAPYGIALSKGDASTYNL
jgi:hypothetical protein